MTGQSAFSLVCYCLLQVSVALLPPENLTIFSENFKHILTWDDPSKETPIYYTVEYSELHKRFYKTKACSNVTARSCDLTKDFTNINVSYRVRVRSFAAGYGSSVSKITASMAPAEITILGPPIVDIAACNRSIGVSVQPPDSYLWSEDAQQYVSMVSHEGFVSMECSIKVQLMNEVISYNIDISEKNYTLIPNLLPNANYCVSVAIMQTVPLNKEPSIPSVVKCVVTEYHENDSGMVYIIVSVIGGVLLLIGLSLALIALDISGYICKARTLIPKVLKSMPTSESIFIDGREFTSPTFSIPVEIISKKIEPEQKPEYEVKTSEGGYANRKRLVESDSSGTTTGGELPSAVSSSGGSSGQTTSSAGEDLSAGSLGNSPPFTVATASLSATEDSSGLPLNDGGVFNINLNTVSIADHAEVCWTGFTQAEAPQEESEDSHEDELTGDQHNSISIETGDLEEEYCSDYEEDDGSDNTDSDSHLISGYMRR